MTHLVEWLLDLDHIRVGRDAPLLTQWNTHYQPWMLFGFALVALAWVTAIYRNERASILCRSVLAAIRLLIIALVLVMICEPSLVLQRNRVEPAYVALLLDRSESMATRDWYEDQALGARLVAGSVLTDASELARRSRLDLIKAMLRAHDGAAIKGLLENNSLQVSAFSGNTETRASATSLASLQAVEQSIDAVTADGSRTDLGGAIRDTIEGASGRRLAAIVLATDGQSTEATNLRDALDLARGRHVPIFPIRIGEPIRPKDLEVGPIRAESSVFVRDVVAIEAPLTARGLDGPLTASVTLTDVNSGTPVDVREVHLGPQQDHVTVELHARPDSAGRAKYQVEVAPIPRERDVRNNVESVEINVVESKLRVLFVDGYPRYEYRYLKNALVREESMELSVLLIDADDQFVQEGTDPIRRFPETPEALRQFDIVIFGDVDPRGGWLTLAQMNMLLDFVGHEGGGFGLIAGERAAPHRFLGTPLERLIPVRIDPEFLGHYAEPLTTGFALQLTPEGRRSRVFRAAPSTREDAADPTDASNPFESLPDLYWTARTLGPKPGAVVLAEHPTMRLPIEQAGGSGLMPIVVTARYGAGKLFFQGTDDTWRWRRHGGELLHDTYWVQVARELMRGDRLVQNRRCIVRTDSRDADYGAPIRVQLEASDERILIDHPETLTISVLESSDDGVPEAVGGPPGPPDATSQPSLVMRFPVHRLGEVSKQYEGNFLPPHPGRFLLVPEGIEQTAGSENTPVTVRVHRPDLESREPEANHKVLERIAAETDGRVVEPDRLTGEFSRIRNQSVLVPDDISEPLWDSRLALLLFTVMISTEWVLRKSFGML